MNKLYVGFRLSYYADTQNKPEKDVVYFLASDRSEIDNIIKEGIEFDDIIFGTKYKDLKDIKYLLSVIKNVKMRDVSEKNASNDGYTGDLTSNFSILGSFLNRIGLELEELFQSPSGVVTYRIYCPTNESGNVFINKYYFYSTTINVNVCFEMSKFIDSYVKDDSVVLEFGKESNSKNSDFYTVTFYRNGDFLVSYINK